MTFGEMNWQLLPSEHYCVYFFILLLLIFVASICSKEMKKRNRYIFASISIVLLLCLPYFRRIPVRNLIENEGYKLIVADNHFYFTQPHLREVDPSLYLKKFAYSFYVSHDAKLVFIGYGKNSSVFLDYATPEEIEFQ